MSNEEFEREFDIEYNNIMSDAAPSIDAYEKSVFLTKAQEEIVIAIYDGSFENTEKLTECIDILVVDKSFKSKDEESVDEHWKMDKKLSKYFKLDNEALVITYEELSPLDKDACGNDVRVLVKPVKQDEYYRICRNPFRRARKNEALRLNAHGFLEIISTYPSYTYKVRYLRRPRPIVLQDFEEGLTIDGVHLKSECELPSMVHRMILDRAVQMAIQIYKN